RYISFFSFTTTAPTAIYPLSLHDALPIWAGAAAHAVHDLAVLHHHASTERAAQFDCAKSAMPPVQRLRRRELLQRQRRHAQFVRSEEHTSELQSRSDLVCRLLLEKKKLYE